MMPQSIGGILLLMLLLILFLILLVACKPWRLCLSSSPRSRPSSLKVTGELERPLISDNLDVLAENDEASRIYDIEGNCDQHDGLLRSPRTEELVHKLRLPSASPASPKADSLILEVAPDHVEDIQLGQTLKFSPLAGRLPEVQKHFSQDNQIPNTHPGSRNDKLSGSPLKDIDDQRSCLSLEVISGPSRGLRCSVQSTSASSLPVTLGRVSGGLLLKDSEVSGKHAMVNWNADKKKWEVVDLGSLNGTLLNSRPINHPDSESRQWSKPVELSNGDVITLGTTSNVQVNVNVTSMSESWIPFGVGMASDPMALRRGGKKLPMEDVCYYSWPLQGIPKFGVFGICDGHGGVAAAKSASKMLPEKVASILANSEIREKVLSEGDASYVLKMAFSQTEASMNNYYEGCTATVLLVWSNGGEEFFAQCANVGDSFCVMNVNGKQIKMTEDHRVTSSSERLRMSGIGKPLKIGETRICGLNLARMLGDKFPKQQDPRFSSEPYISEVVHIDQSSSCYALIASDGFWDVVSVKKAVQLIQQENEKQHADGENPAEKVANVLLSEAKEQRTKDNTSILFLDFKTKYRSPPCKVTSQ
ncbi:Protein phosphatase 2C 70 [Linum perenne]